MYILKITSQAEKSTESQSISENDGPRAPGSGPMARSRPRIRVLVQSVWRVFSPLSEYSSPQFISSTNTTSSDVHRQKAQVRVLLQFNLVFFILIFCLSCSESLLVRNKLRMKEKWDVAAASIQSPSGRLLELWSLIVDLDKRQPLVKYYVGRTARPRCSRSQENEKSILGDSEARPREEYPEDWSTLLTHRVKILQESVGELGVSMVTCSSARRITRSLGRSTPSDRAEEHL